MIDETTKHHWLRIGAIALMTFIIAFLAFYIVMEIMIHKITDPIYQAKRMEKILVKQEREFNKYNEQQINNPFEPKMRPMIVNLVKEPREYKIIIDLSHFNGDEKAINILINDEELTVIGEMDKKIRGTEKIIKFTQTYYLDEKLKEDNMIKEKKGDKYIITIPFETEENEDDD